MSRVGYQEAEDTLEWRKEKQRETSIPRYCVTCGDFKQFKFKSKNHQWIFLFCSTCQGRIKISRK